MRPQPAPTLVLQSLTPARFEKWRENLLDLRAQAAPPFVESKEARKQRHYLSRDPLRFCKLYLPHYFPDEWSPDHRTAADAYLAPGFTLVAGYREFGKTAQSVGMMLFAALAKGLRFIVPVGEDELTSAWKVVAVREELQHNARLRQDYPDFCRLEQAADTEIVFGPHRCKILARGSRQGVRGLLWLAQRPQLVVYDDIDRIESSQNERITERRVAKILVEDAGALAAGSSAVWLGNLYSSSCALATAFDRVERERLPVRLLRFPVEDSDGNSRWSARFPPERLAYLRRIMGLAYRGEMLCEPADPDALIALQWFRYAPRDELWREPREWLFVVVDANFKAGRRESNHSAILLMGPGQEGRTIDLLDGHLESYSDAGLVHAVLQRLVAWKRAFPQLRELFMEEPGNALFPPLFREIAPQYGLHGFAPSLLPQRGDKDMRIAGNSANIEQGVCRFADCDLSRIIAMQYHRGHKSKLKDGADAHELGTRICERRVGQVMGHYSPRAERDKWRGEHDPRGWRPRAGGIPRGAY